MKNIYFYSILIILFFSQPNSLLAVHKDPIQPEKETFITKARQFSGSAKHHVQVLQKQRKEKKKKSPLSRITTLWATFASSTLVSYAIGFISFFFLIGGAGDVVLILFILSVILSIVFALMTIIFGAMWFIKAKKPQEPNQKKPFVNTNKKIFILLTTLTLLLLSPIFLFNGTIAFQFSIVTAVLALIYGIITWFNYKSFQKKIAQENYK